MTIKNFTARRRKPFVPQREKPKKRTTMYDAAGNLVIPNGRDNPANVAPNGTLALSLLASVQAKARIRQALQPALDADRAEWLQALQLIEEIRAADAEAVAMAARFERDEVETLARADQYRGVVRDDPEFHRVRGDDQVEWQLLPPEATLIWRSVIVGEQDDFVAEGLAKARSTDDWPLTISTFRGDPQVRYEEDGRILIAKPVPDSPSYQVLIPA